MRLTRVLLFYVKKKKIPGNLDIGKHQRVLPVLNSQKVEAVKQMVLEQENIDVIAKSWLTEAEEESYAKHIHELRIPELEKQIAVDKQRAKTMLKHHDMTEYLEHLNVAKAYE